MNAEETGKLLATCATFDRRTTGEADVIAWLRVLGDLDYRECEAAVIGYYADSRDWIMPADIRSRVMRERRAAAGRARRAALNAGQPPAFSPAIIAQAEKRGQLKDPRPWGETIRAILTRHGRPELGS